MESQTDPEIRWAIKLTEQTRRKVASCHRTLLASQMDPEIRWAIKLTEQTRRKVASCHRAFRVVVLILFNRLAKLVWHNNQMTPSDRYGANRDR